MGILCVLDMLDIFKYLNIFIALKTPLWEENYSQPLPNKTGLMQFKNIK